jgi:hypothetical protein
MRSDWERELRTLQKWRDSAAPIKLQLVGSSFTVQGWAFIARADDFEIALNLDGGAGFFVFDPSKCSFQYSDPAEAGKSVSVDPRVICAISGRLTDGLDLFMYEWKHSGEPKPVLDMKIPPR